MTSVWRNGNQWQHHIVMAIMGHGENNRRRNIGIESQSAKEK
jgi:hypothetical protein